jgi:hypothetical protein
MLLLRLLLLWLLLPPPLLLLLLLLLLLPTELPIALPAPSAECVAITTKTSVLIFESCSGRKCTVCL